MDDEALARELQPQLRGARGFAPALHHIRAAILMARDHTLSSREACRRVPGVSEGNRDRVAALVPRVRAKLPAQGGPPLGAGATSSAASLVAAMGTASASRGAPAFCYAGARGGCM